MEEDLNISGQHIIFTELIDFGNSTQYNTGSNHERFRGYQRRMPLNYLLDDQGNPYPSDDMHAIGELLGNIEKRRVAKTEKDVAGHHLRVSTVFLVLDHNHDYENNNPILFETMLFIDGSSEISSATRRYYTRQEATEGHEEVVDDMERVLMMMQQHNIGIEQIAGLLMEGGIKDV